MIKFGKVFNEKLECGAAELQVVQHESVLFTGGRGGRGVVKITLKFKDKLGLVASVLLDKEKNTLELFTSPYNLPQFRKALNALDSDKRNFLHDFADYIQEKFL